MQLLKKIAFPLFFLFLAMALHAADPVIDVRVDPPVIGLDERATVILQLDRQAQKIQPVGDREYGLQYGGESHSSQVTIINGVVQSKSTFQYTFIVTPKKTGGFTLGKFEVTVNGKKYTAPAQDIQFKVVRKNQRKAVNPADPFAQIDEFFNGRNRVPAIAFRLIPRTSTALQNQQVILDGYLESPERSSFDYQYSQVSDIRSDKCALFDISDTIKPSIQKIGGVFRKLVKRYVIYPVETGKIGIAPPNIIAVTPYGQLQLKSEVIGIDSTKLNDRSGLSYVGELTVKLTLSANRIEVGKNCEITLVMTGNGNLKVLSNPYNDLHSGGIFLSSPVTDLKFLEYRGNRAFFRQQVKYLMMTKKPGTYRVPPLVIRYYDDKGTPRSLEIASFTVESTEKEQTIRKENLSLKPLKNSSDFRFLLFTPWMILLLVLFSLLPVGAAFFGLHRERLANDPDYARKYLADKRLTGYFAQAENKLRQNDTKGFYSSAQNGLFFYLTDKLNLPSGTGYRELLNELKTRHVDEEVISLFVDIYSECSRNAFSGQADSGSTGDIMNKIKRITELTKK